MVIRQTNVEILPKRGIRRKSAQSTNAGRAKIRKKKITLDAEAIPTPETLRKWVGIQVPYENLAGQSEEKDARATSYVLQIVKRFQQAHIETFRKWSLIRRLMDSMKGGPGEGESPEIYKAMERMIPRIEDATIGYDRWFTTAGRRTYNKRQTDLITHFLDYQLDQINWVEKVNPGIRTMLSYGFAAYKTWWETKTERRIKRKTVPREVAGKKKFTITLEEEEVVTFNGPRAELVDPYDFIMDTEAIEVCDAKFVGNIYRMTYREMLEWQEQGIFNNVANLADVPPIARNDYNSWYKIDRDRGATETVYSRRHIEGLPYEYFLVDMWGYFDLYDNGLAIPCVVTVANYQYPVRIQENPYDDKHIPYAICRANREPFDFFATAPFDNTIRPQLQMNEHRALAMKAHKLALSPILLTDEGDDLPDSIWEIEPGSVLAVPNPQNVVPLAVKTTVPEMILSDNVHKSDIEEASGSTQMLGGTEDSGTATEAMTKMQESSRRLRSYSHSFALGSNQLLRQFHALNAQYVTSAMTFRVLGKPGKGLTAYAEIDPEVLQQEVDFEFKALASLHSGDLRANLVLQYMNLSAPTSAKYPGQVNELLLLHTLAGDMLGGVIDADDVVTIPTKPELLMSQRSENILLVQGQIVEIDRQDDDEEHLANMEELMDSLDEFTGSIQAAIIKHYEAHANAIENKAAMERQRMMGGTPASFAPPAEEFDPTRGTTGEQKQPGDDPSAFMSMDGGGGGNMMGQTPGQNPGPPNQSGMSATDRTQGIFSSQRSA